MDCAPLRYEFQRFFSSSNIENRIEINLNSLAVIDDRNHFILKRGSLLSTLHNSKKFFLPICVVSMKNNIA